MNHNILTNIPLMCALVACLVAQALKPIISKIINNKYNFSYLISTGGMPSSHSASTVALATSIALIQGANSTAFAIAATISFVVMHDATGIRNEAGKQARVINEWSKILSKIHEDGQITPENLKTMLGHTFPQVLAGAVLGMIIGGIGTYLLYPLY